MPFYVVLMLWFDALFWPNVAGSGSFYYRSKLNEWCEAKTAHDGVAGPDTDLFVDLSGASDGGEMLSSLRSNDLHDFIDETWAELKAKQSELGLTDEELYYAVESLSCKFHRENGLNSCYDAEDEVMAGGQYETCDSLDIESAAEVTLDDMLNFGGVSGSECLRKRRSELYSVSGSGLFGDSITMNLCNGEYDYFCPDWEHEEADSLRQAVQQRLSAKGEGFQFESADSFNYAVSSFAVFGLFISCFVVKALCCRRKEKGLDLQTLNFDEEEEIYGTF